MTPSTSPSALRSLAIFFALRGVGASPSHCPSSDDPTVLDETWLECRTKQILQGCLEPIISRIKGNASFVFTPDASHSYGAQWTRDFYYIVSGAADLLDRDLVMNSIRFTFSGQRPDGCMPDRVQTDGKSVYSPGAPPGFADHAWDNGPFAALLLAAASAAWPDTAQRTNFFCELEPRARAALSFVNRSSTSHLVWNDVRMPNCTYGFTDTVRKTGALLFTSLLYADASQQMGAAARKFGCGDAARYEREAAAVGGAIDQLHEGPLWLAASHDNSLPDVWGSAYAVALNLSSPARREVAVAELASRSERYFSAGQVRSLPSPLTWERCCWSEGCSGGCSANGTYQNGAFWATPLPYVVRALLATGRADFAEQLLHATISDFKRGGIYEDVDYGRPTASKGVLNYTASATNTLLAVRELKEWQRTARRQQRERGETATAAAAAQAVSVSVDWATSPVGFVDSRELSWTWDIYALNPAKFPGPFDLRSQALRNLTRQLGPAVLRVSGTSVENAQIDAGPHNFAPPLPPAVRAVLRSGGGGTAPFNATFADFDEVVAFAAATRSQMVLGLNQLTRKWPEGGLCHASGSGRCPWVSTNARAWMEHNRAVNATILGYELGNEPGCYMDVAKQHSTGLSAADAVDDFHALQALIAEVYKQEEAASRPRVMGPDVGGCKHGELNAAILAGQPPLDVLTFHHYVIGGAVAHGNPADINVSAMVKAALSTTTRDVISSYLPAWRQNASQAALWLGEGGTTCANPALQSSFAMIYNAFNILREGALLGVSLFLKQSLHDMYQVERHGDGVRCLAFYWFALLWKREMALPDGAPDAGGSNGTPVRNASTSSATVLAVARGPKLALLNLGEEEVMAAVPLGTRAGGQCLMHTLSPDSDGPSSTGALVNGKSLAAGPDGSLPDITPVSVKCCTVPIPSMSVVFVAARL